MLLWLQRAWSDDLPAAVIRGVKSVGGYKMSAGIILCMTSKARAAGELSRAFKPPEPHKASFVWLKKLNAMARKLVNKKAVFYTFFANMHWTK